VTAAAGTINTAASWAVRISAAQSRADHRRESLVLQRRRPRLAAVVRHALSGLVGGPTRLYPPKRPGTCVLGNQHQSMRRERRRILESELDGLRLLPFDELQRRFAGDRAGPTLRRCGSRHYEISVAVEPDALWTSAIQLTVTVRELPARRHPLAGGFVMTKDSTIVGEVALMHFNARRA
jgi:hypothetical protein